MTDKLEYVVEVTDLTPDPITISISEDLRISENLELEIARCAAQFGYYSIVAEKANTRLRKLKISYALWHAHALKYEKEENGIKTIAEAERVVMFSAKWKAYQMKLIKFEEEAKSLRHIARSFELKKDLIQTTASNRRSEINDKMGG
jgi:hypothetical protein